MAKQEKRRTSSYADFPVCTQEETRMRDIPCPANRTGESLFILQSEGVLRCKHQKLYLTS